MHYIHISRGSSIQSLADGTVKTLAAKAPAHTAALSEYFFYCVEERLRRWARVDVRREAHALPIEAHTCSSGIFRPPV